MDRLDRLDMAYVKIAMLRDPSPEARAHPTVTATTIAPAKAGCEGAHESEGALCLRMRLQLRLPLSWRLCTRQPAN